MVMPVATPMAKLMPNSVPQNFVMSRQIVAAGHDIDALHDREQHREPEGQRHEEEVVHRGQRELQARQLHGNRADHFWPPICWKCAATVSAVMVGRSAGAKNKA